MVAARLLICMNVQMQDRIVVVVAELYDACRYSIRCMLFGASDFLAIQHTTLFGEPALT
jgi:hypothetical protein